MADLNRLLPDMSKHEHRAAIVGDKGKGSIFFFFLSTRVKVLLNCYQFSLDLLVLKEVRKWRQSGGGLGVALRVTFHIMSAAQNIITR